MRGSELICKGTPTRDKFRSRQHHLFNKKEHLNEQINVKTNKMFNSLMCLYHMYFYHAYMQHRAAVSCPTPDAGSLNHTS